MTLQQYQENTFSIQPVFTFKTGVGPLIMPSNSDSFHVAFDLLPDTDKLKNFCAELKNPPSLNSEIVIKIANRLGLAYFGENDISAGGEVCFANSPEVRPGFRLTFSAADVFDYAYALLHSPVYMDTYKEFWKSDSPRVPYPNDTTTFWQLVKLGSELKQTHLSAIIESERIVQEIAKVEIEFG